METSMTLSGKRIASVKGQRLLNTSHEPPTKKKKKLADTCSNDHYNQAV